jgi:hypothetical protein
MDSDGKTAVQREILIAELKETGLDTFRRRHYGHSFEADVALLRLLDPEASGQTGSTHRVVTDCDSFPGQSIGFISADSS